MSDTDLGLTARSEVAVRGVALGSTIPLRRPGGAGPSADGHVLVDGLKTTVPIVADSPYRLRDGRLVRRDPDGAVTDMGVTIDTVARPAFYDLTTADGVPYEKIARLHGNDVLATTVMQTCVRYGSDSDNADRCRFCAIEQSLDSGATTAVKTPDQLAEVAEAAVRLDGVTQMVLTTGTSNGRDRGARHLARCVRAIKAAVPGLPVQVQCEPPAPSDLAALAELHDAGADAIGIHVESLDDAVRARWMPGKATVPLGQYWLAWDERAPVRRECRLHLPHRRARRGPRRAGRGRRRAGRARRLPLRGALPPDPRDARVRRRRPGPAAEMLAEVTGRVATVLQAAGMRGTDQAAGCAACGACSALSAAGG